MRDTVQYNRLLQTIKRANADIRSYRKQVAALKRAGLISKKIDARSHRPTKYMIQQINAFPDVVAGRARAVNVFERSVAETYMRNKGTRVIVPISRGDRARWSKKEGAVIVNRARPIPTVPSDQQLYYPDKNVDFGVRPLAPGQMYLIENRGGGVSGSKSFETLAELENFISRYDPENEGDRRRWKRQGRKLFKDARQYVSIGRRR